MTKPIISITEDELNKFLYDGETPETDFNEDDFYSSLDDIEVPGVDSNVNVDNTVTDDLDDVENIDTAIVPEDDFDTTLTDTPVVSDINSNDAYSEIQTHLDAVRNLITNVRVGDFKILLQQLESLTVEARQKGREQLVESLNLKKHLKGKK